MLNHIDKVLSFAVGMITASRRFELKIIISMSYFRNPLQKGLETRANDKWLAAPAIGRDALVRNPDAGRQRAYSVKNVDWHAAARIPITADAQPMRIERCG